MNAVRSLAPTRSRELPAACAELAAWLHATPLAELPDDEVLRLSERYEAAVAGPETHENEILRLLTRSFSRRLDIPEYYRYTGLHVAAGTSPGRTTRTRRACCCCTRSWPT